MSSPHDQYYDEDRRRWSIWEDDDDLRDYEVTYEEAEDGNDPFE